jgi:hypothetical protein
MASVVVTGASAQEAALEYLAQRHPALAGGNLAVLRLESGWLVETAPAAAGGDGAAEKVMLMVSRHGSVEEIGRSLPRQNAQRCLTVLQAAVRPVPRFA